MKCARVLLERAFEGGYGCDQENFFVTEVNRYMRTVLREEPLDPGLEEFDDELAW